MRLVDNDGDGMITLDEVLSVRSLSTREDRNNSVFTGNTSLVSFREFKMFTSLDSISSTSFNGCTSLTDIEFPPVVLIGDEVLNGCTALRRVIVPEGVNTIKSGFVSGGDSLILVDLPSTIQSLGSNFCHANRSPFKLICRAATPPTFGGFGYTHVELEGIYVPDGSVDSYKVADGWNNKASVIKPLSQYTG